MKKSVKIFIEYDRTSRIYTLYTKKWKYSEPHKYLSLRAVKGGLYNTLKEIGDCPFTLICSKRITERLFEPERDKFDI